MTEPSRTTNPNLYQLYDLTARSVAGPIMIEKRDAPAIRLFHSLLANPDTQPGRYPDDFELRLIGEQNEYTSQITALDPQTVATGAGWVEQQRRLQQERLNAET